MTNKSCTIDDPYRASCRYESCPIWRRRITHEWLVRSVPSTILIELESFVCDMTHLHLKWLISAGHLRSSASPSYESYIHDMSRIRDEDRANHPPSDTVSHCNTIRHLATHCNTWQWRSSASPSLCQRNTLQHTATHCNTLQHTATHSNTLQHTATHYNTLQHTATHGDEVQTHCPPRNHYVWNDSLYDMLNAWHIHVTWWSIIQWVIISHVYKTMTHVREIIYEMRTHAVPPVWKHKIPYRIGDRDQARRPANVPAYASHLQFVVQMYPCVRARPCAPVCMLFVRVLTCKRIFIRLYVYMYMYTHVYVYV